jgi:hypothetical protein
MDAIVVSSMVSERSRSLGEFVVVSHEHPAITRDGHVFRGVEAERTNIGDASCLLTVSLREVGLTRIRENIQIMFVGDLGDTSHLGHLSVEVNGDHRRRIVGSIDFRFEVIGVDRIRIAAHIDENGIRIK